MSKWNNDGQDKTIIYELDDAVAWGKTPGDADTIVREHNTHELLLAALKNHNIPDVDGEFADVLVDLSGTLARQWGVNDWVDWLRDKAESIRQTIILAKETRCPPSTSPKSLPIKSRPHYLGGKPGLS